MWLSFKTVAVSWSLLIAMARMVDATTLSPEEELRELLLPPEDPPKGKFVVDIHLENDCNWGILNIEPVTQCIGAANVCETTGAGKEIRSRRTQRSCRFLQPLS